MLILMSLKIIGEEMENIIQKTKITIKLKTKVKHTGVKLLKPKHLK